MVKVKNSDTKTDNQTPLSPNIKVVTRIDSGINRNPLKDETKLAYNVFFIDVR